MIANQDIPRLTELLHGFAGKRILVLGDIMIDQFIWGQVERISPEAPVPVVLVQDESSRLGGAANVVNNIRSLGGHPIMAGLLGQDDLGDLAMRLMERSGVDPAGVVVSEQMRTIVKTRIVAQQQQVVRVDREGRGLLGPGAISQLMEHMRRIIPTVDAVAISDYAKGVVTPDLAAEVIGLARRHEKVVVVDPKVKNIANYAGCTVITPNHHEAGEATGIRIVDRESIRRAASILFEQVKCDAVLITCGERGMVLFEGNGRVTPIDTVARQVFDVTGAGDTVISSLALGLACGASLPDAAVVANFAAGIVVGKVGTATADPEEIVKAMQNHVTDRGAAG